MRVMSGLFSLPPELRDQIWAYACHREDAWCSEGFGGLRHSTNTKADTSKSRSLYRYLRICRQACNEVTPFLYQTVCINVCHPNEVIRWLGTIGARNSACIRHLVIRFVSLLLKFNEARFVDDRIRAWDAALRALPRLLSLTFDFEQDSNVSMIWANLDDDMLIHDPHVGNELAISATAWAKRLRPYPDSEAEAWDYRPDLRRKPITHAVIAMDESVPPILSDYFSKLLALSNKTSLEQTVTGLPANFFEDSGFHLTRTFSLSEDPQHPSLAMSFGRTARSRFNTLLPSLRATLDQLPQLLWLRVGCRNIDSSFLTFIPPSVSTLDVAFADTDPEQIAENLGIMRERCKSLFSMAIQVSPLHDQQFSTLGDEIFFDKSLLTTEVLSRWEPFWDALEGLKAGGLRIWEGEAPGFSRNKS